MKQEDPFELLSQISSQEAVLALHEAGAGANLTQRASKLEVIAVAREWAVNETRRRKLRIAVGKYLDAPAPSSSTPSGEDGTRAVPNPKPHRRRTDGAAPAPGGDRTYKVFVSSTWLDNQQRRKVVEDAILHAGMLPVGMERFAADTRPALDTCVDYVRQSDVLVGILAWRYGFIPEGREFSITELEYDAASERLMFLLDPALPVNPERDFDEGLDRWRKQQKLQDFKNRASREQTPVPFNDTTLGEKVLHSLLEWARRKKAERPPPEPEPEEPKPRRRATRVQRALDAEIERYLKKADTFYAHLPVAGFARGIKVPIDIAEIYVPLRAVLDLSGEDREEFADAAHAEKCLAGQQRHTEISLPEAFRRAGPTKRRGAVILGDPGSGKTTHLKRLLLWCIREGPEKIALPAGIVPVFLPLRNLRDLGSGLDVFIQDELADPQLGTADGFGERLLERGNLLFLLDGLDEVADEAQRAEVSEWINAGVLAHGTCRFAVTCRYAGYTQGAALNEQFIETHIRPMTADQAESFVRKWYRIVEYGSSTDPEQADITANQQADDLVQSLRSPDFRARRVFELTRSPLLLTNICLVHRYRNRLPQKRARLYDDCIDVLLEHWQGAKDRSKDKGKAEAPGLTIDAKAGRRVLQPTAYWMHGEDGRTRATADELVPVVRPALRAIGWEAGDVAAFLEKVRNSSGVLTGWGHRHYGFMHLGFQEYLAAREILRRVGAEPALLKGLAAHFGDSWWQEVVLLLLALEEQSQFVPFMREVVQLPRFADHPGLVDACLEDAAEPDSLPFVELLRQGPGTDTELWRRQAQALRVVERIDKAAVEALADLLRTHPCDDIRARFAARRAEAGRGLLAAPRGGYELVRIPGGSFTMGSPESEKGRYSDEGPQHRVTIAPFAIGRYPVPNEQYAVFLEQNPDAPEPKYWADRDRNQPRQPVVGVSWEDAKRYAEWAGLRLPTEAEWEYACRAGTTSAFNDGSDCTEPDGKDPALDRLGWFSKNSGGRAHLVGEKQPNAWGLYDMHGNVWEWCEDEWHGNYKGAPDDGSAWVDDRGGEGRDRVIRGGGWPDWARSCRCACRDGGGPGGRVIFLGFRLVLAPSSARASRPFP